MTKLTKKQYTKAMEILENQLKSVNEMLELADKTEGAIFSDIDQWNEYHDRAYDIEKEMKDLDEMWNRRNWTTSDYNLHSLIAQNID